jgi:hypothetical protein
MSYLLSDIFQQLCEAFRTGNAARKRDSAQDTADSGIDILPSHIFKKYFGDSMEPVTEADYLMTYIEGRADGTGFLMTWINGFTDGRNLVRIQFRDEWPLIADKNLFLKAYYDDGGKDYINFGDAADAAELTDICRQIEEVCNGDDETEEDDE